jgi:hypothetical protein
VENKGKKITRSGRWGKKTKITLRKWGAKEKNKVTRNKEGMQTDFFFATMGTWR